MTRRAGSGPSSRRTGLLVAAGAVVVLVVAALTAGSTGSAIGWAGAVLLGFVEGVTEYLPVSSTGHLAVLSELLWPDADATQRAAIDSYLIVIQGGAITAVVGLYRQRFVHMARGLVEMGTGRRLAAAIVVAFIPAALVGFLLGDLVKDRLFGLAPIAWAWIIGGVVILIVDRAFADRGGVDLDGIDMRRASWIGLAQVLALWPGTSRSLVTILGGRGAGLSTSAAVEFSFLLGAVTLLAASVYEAAGNAGTILTSIGLGPALVGFVTATLAAAAAVKWLVSYLARHSMAVFGWYRIAIGLIVLVVYVL